MEFIKTVNVVPITAVSSRLARYSRRPHYHADVYLLDAVTDWNGGWRCRCLAFWRTSIKYSARSVTVRSSTLSTMN